MTVPCPGCDVQHSDDPLLSLAIGVALGSAFNMHKVTELMCSAHRTPYVIAMMHAQVALNTIEDGSAPSSMFDEAIAEDDAGQTGSKTGSDG